MGKYWRFWEESGEETAAGDCQSFFVLFKTFKKDFKILTYYTNDFVMTEIIESYQESSMVNPLICI